MVSWILIFFKNQYICIRFLKESSHNGIAAVLPQRDPFGKNRRSKMKYTVYILRSMKDGKYYYGHTDNMDKRLKIHNSGKVRSTKSRKPLIIHYKEEVDSKSGAYKREKFFKTIEGYKYLRSNGIIK